MAHFIYVGHPNSAAVAGNNLSNLTLDKLIKIIINDTTSSSSLSLSSSSAAPSLLVRCNIFAGNKNDKDCSGSGGATDLKWQ